MKLLCDVIKISFQIRNERLRHFLLFSFKQDHKSAKAARDIYAVYGDGIPTKYEILQKNQKANDKLYAEQDSRSNSSERDLISERT